jgi:hypothetical protein
MELVEGPTLADIKIKPDDQRFLINLATVESNATPFTIVTNWTQALKKYVSEAATETPDCPSRIKAASVRMRGSILGHSVRRSIPMA